MESGFLEKGNTDNLKTFLMTTSELIWILLAPLYNTFA